jgi:hypothetical protein
MRHDTAGRSGPVAFPEISEVSGKAAGLHSYTPVARH